MEKIKILAELIAQDCFTKKKVRVTFIASGFEYGPERWIEVISNIKTFYFEDIAKLKKTLLKFCYYPTSNSKNAFRRKNQDGRELLYMTHRHRILKIHYVGKKVFFALYSPNSTLKMHKQDIRWLFNIKK